VATQTPARRLLGEAFVLVDDSLVLLLQHGNFQWANMFPNQSTTNHSTTTAFHPVAAGEVRPRPRSGVACRKCRLRKVRCDLASSGRPCANCQFDGVVCEVLPRKKTGLDMLRAIFLFDPDLTRSSVGMVERRESTFCVCVKRREMWKANPHSTLLPRAVILWSGHRL